MRRLSPALPPAAMVWWRTGSLGPLLLTALTAAVALRWLPLQAEVPQLRTADPAAAPLTLLLILPVAIAIQTTTIEPSHAIHRTGTPLRQQAGLVRVAALTIALVALVAVIAPHHQHPAISITLTGVGEALISARLCGNRLAWLLPITHASVSAFLGTRTLLGRSWWAWPAAAEPTTTDYTLAAATLAIGLIAFLLPATLSKRTSTTS